MGRGHDHGVQLSRQRYASAVVRAEGNGGGGGNGRSGRETVVDESRKKMADRVARHQANYTVGSRTCLCYY